MDSNKVQEWSNVMDIAEQSPITSNLPKEAPAGILFEDKSDDGVYRKWLRVDIVGGNTGGRWAYWAPWFNEGRIGVGPHPQYKALADGIFNGDAAHFIGMLGIPYVKTPGVSTLMWVMIEPRSVGGRIPTVVDEKPSMRYEKSREVFDVETQTTTKLP